MGVGGDCAEVAAGKFAVSKAATFSAEAKGDVLLGWRQFYGEGGQGNGGGEAVSEAEGVADDKVGWGDGVLQDGLGLGAVRWAAEFGESQGLTRPELGCRSCSWRGRRRRCFPRGMVPLGRRDS